MTTEMKHSQIDSQDIQFPDNCSDYKSWSSVDAAKWIISIDSKFEKYRETLNNSFDKNHFNVELIADHEDLKQYGIIDLDDRKTIYTAITQLMDKEIASSNLSPSDDEKDALERNYSHETQSSLCSDTEQKEQQTVYNNLQLQRQRLMDNGYCEWISDERYKEIVINLTSGYIRNNYKQDQQFPLTLNNDIYALVQIFYGITFESFGVGEMVQLQLGPDRYLSAITNVSLSAVWKSRVAESNIIIVEQDKMTKDTLERILTYLGHHEGIEADQIPCPVRSIDMRSICSDQWDADWIDAFDKKTIFELITGANDLQIKSLLHLGCAKIATLIKQMDQKEINRVIEEEDKYRREHAATNNATNNTEDTEENEQRVQGIDIEESKQLYASSINPTIMMLDELLSIFDC